MSCMHRKQAQGEGSHESRDNGVSRVMKPYRVSHGQNASTGSRVSRVMRPRGLTSHETLARMQRKQAQGQGSHESRESVVSRVMGPYRVLHDNEQNASTGSKAPGVMRPDWASHAQKAQAQDPGSHES